MLMHLWQYSFGQELYRTSNFWRLCGENFLICPSSIHWISWSVRWLHCLYWSFWYVPSVETPSILRFLRRFNMEFGTYVQVISFFDRKIYTWCFLVLGITGSTYVAFFIQASPVLGIYIWLACWFLSVFTLMPAEIPENNNLVYASFTAFMHAFSCIFSSPRREQAVACT